MIEKENENEKYYAIFKVVAISLIYFIIGIFIIFMVGVSKVNAATWSGVYDKSDVTNSTNGNNEGTSTSAFYGSSTGTNVPIVIPSSLLFKGNLNQLGLGVIQTGDFKQNTQYEFEISFKAQIGNWGPSATDWAMGGNVLLGNMAGVQQNVSNRTFTRTNIRSTTRKVLGKTIQVHEALYTLSGTFTASTNQTRISFLFPNNTSSNLYNGIWYQDIQISINSLNTDKTNGDIINNNNSNTNKIINNQNQNTQEQIENDNANTQELIENQNENNEKVLDAFDKTWNVCDNFNRSYQTVIGTLNGEDGQEIEVTTRTRTDYIEVLPNTTYKITANGLIYVFEYKEDKTWIDRIPTYWTSSPYTFTTNANAKWVRVVIDNGTIQTINIEGTICKNRIDVQVEWEEDNNKTLKDILGGITSSDTDEPNSDLEDMGDSLASDSAISDLLLLPVTLYQNVLNNINGTCRPFNLGNLLGTDLTMPCINISSFLGNALYGTIDVLMSGFFILGIRKKFVDIFESLTSLRTGGNELE